VGIDLQEKSSLEIVRRCMVQSVSGYNMAESNSPYRLHC
jgi:hypothetical protein